MKDCENIFLLKEGIDYGLSNMLIESTEQNNQNDGLIQLISPIVTKLLCTKMFKELIILKRDRSTSPIEF